LIADNSVKAGAGKITFNLAWQRNQRQEYGNAMNPEEKSLYFDLKTFNYSTAYHFDDKKGWASSIGISGMYQNNQNKGLEALIPEYDLFDVGAFFYTQKTIHKTTFSGGLRFDNRSLNSKEYKEGSEVKFDGFKKDFSNLSGSAGISYAATPNFILKMNLARGFRAPSIPELASNGAHEGTNRYEYGDPNLKSENSWQGDMGFELNSEHVLFSASAFYNSIQNFIFYRKLLNNSGADSLVQVGQEFIPAYKYDQHSARLVGFEALVDLHPHPLDWLHWQNTISYVRGSFQNEIDGSKHLPFIPATRWISHVRADLLSKGKSLQKISVYFELDQSFDQNRPFTSYGTETATPGYTLLNAGLTANINSKNKPLFSVYLLGQNLGDVAYQSHLSRLKYAAMNPVSGRQGVFNMGRSFVFKINVPLSF
jgi:iron complex outermembrane recepter protein